MAAVSVGSGRGEIGQARRVLGQLSVELGTPEAEPAGAEPVGRDDAAADGLVEGGARPVAEVGGGLVGGHPGVTLL